MNAGGLDVSDVTFRAIPHLPVSIALGALLALTLLLSVRTLLRAEQVVTD